MYSDFNYLFVYRFPCENAKSCDIVPSSNANGTRHNKTCQFPFVHQNKNFTNCIDNNEV